MLGKMPFWGFQGQKWHKIHVFHIKYSLSHPCLGLKTSIQNFDAFVLKMHADGKSTLASVSKWNSGKVN